MEVNFVYFGEPVGKGRPKFTVTGHAYTPPNTRNAEEQIKLIYKMKYRGFKFDADKELAINIFAYYQIPKSDSKVIREKKKKGEIRPKKKPDGDNVLKLVCDALNKTAYHDDSQIVDFHVKKYYSDVPGIKVIINEVVPDIHT